MSSELSTSYLRGPSSRNSLQNASVDQMKSELEQEQLVSADLRLKLDRSEQMLIAHQNELAREREEVDDLRRSKLALEKQVKDLNIRLVDLEASSAMGRPTRSNSRVSELASVLERETAQRTAVTLPSRQAERQIRELQFQLSERDKAMSRHVEDLKRAEERMSRMRSQLDELVRLLFLF